MIVNSNIFWRESSRPFFILHLWHSWYMFPVVWSGNWLEKSGKSREKVWNFVQSKGWEPCAANLAGCKHCRLGPLYLTPQYLEGEQICGLSGYLYIRCPNLECYKLNRVAYGKTHHPVSEKGNVSFVVNTKLGLG